MQAASCATSMKPVVVWSDVAEFAGRIVAYKVKPMQLDNFTFENSKKYFGIISNTAQRFARMNRPMGYTLIAFVKTKTAPICHECLIDEQLKGKSLRMRVATLEEVKGLSLNKAYCPTLLSWKHHIDLATKDMELTPSTPIQFSEREKAVVDDGSNLVDAVEILSFLLQQGASNVRADTENIIDFIDKGDQKKFEMACERNPEIINTANSIGETPLCYACSIGQVGITKYLLDKGADVHIKTKVGGLTAMHAAAFKGSLDCVKALYEKDPKTAEARSKEGTSVLYWASWGGHPHVVSFLNHEAKVDLHHADAKGMTALLIAAKSGHKEVVEMLYTNDPKTIEAEDLQGRDAYSLACMYNYGNENHNVINFFLAMPGLNIKETKVKVKLVWDN